MEIRSKVSPGIIQKTPSKLVFLYSFNVALGLLDQLLELKGVKHESEAGEQWAQAFLGGHVFWVFFRFTLI